jgi:hypothetical protein
LKATFSKLELFAGMISRPRGSTGILVPVPPHGPQTCHFDWM